MKNNMNYKKYRNNETGKRSYRTGMARDRRGWHRLRKGVQMRPLEQVVSGPWQDE